MAVRSLTEFKGALKGKKVLIRVDFNVPLDKKTGEITDDRRISACLPTIRFVREEGGIPVLMSHLGRPKGERKPEFSLAPVAKRLGELLGAGAIFDIPIHTSLKPITMFILAPGAFVALGSILGFVAWRRLRREERECAEAAGKYRAELIITSKNKPE